MTPAIPGLTMGQARRAFAPVKAQPRGIRAAFPGDSITAGNEGGAIDQQGPSYPNMVGVLSMQRIEKVINAGRPGWRSDQILAVFDTDVAAYSPSLVSPMFGTNDANQGVPLATFAANVRAYVAKIRSIGARPVLSAIMPNNVTADRRKLTVQYNAWLRRYAADEGIDLVDMYARFVDPATGGFIASLTSDGTHPKNGTNLLMAQLFIDTVLPKVASVAPLLPCENADPWNLISNGLFLGATSGTSGAGGTIMPSGFTRVGGRDANTTAQLVTGDSSIIGNWWDLTAAASTTGELFYQNIGGSTSITGCSFAATGDLVTKTAHGLVNGQVVTLSAISGVAGVKTSTPYFVINATANTFQLAATAGGSPIDITADGTATVTYSTLIIPGHRYSFIHRVKATGLRNANSGAGATFLSKAVFNGKTNADPLYDFRALNTVSYDIAAGVAKVEFVAPADAYSLQVQFSAAVTTSSSYHAAVAQIGLFDLTAMGLA